MLQSFENEFLSPGYFLVFDIYFAQSGKYEHLDQNRERITRKPKPVCPFCQNFLDYSTGCL
jgi:hypothetical protein